LKSIGVSVGVDDKPLARVQFAGALAAAVEAGLAPASALTSAADLIAADQQPDGSLRLDPSDSLGSPATYGTALATWAARRTTPRHLDVSLRNGSASESGLAPRSARSNRSTSNARPIRLPARSSRIVKATSR
jgi:hypothetical protein